jgi:hypothetical protein
LWTALLSAAAGAGTAFYSFAVERHWLDINEITLPLPRLGKAFEGYRIAHISDLHAETWFPPAYFEQVITAVNQLEPDMIVITGDFVHRDVTPVAESLAAGLRALRAADGVFGVLGNHDHWGDGEAVRRAVVAGNVHDLNNTIHTLRRGGDTLHIGGVDSYLENKARLDLVLKALPDEGAAILLAHEPDFAHVSSATERFDLQLSGHSHGGQVRLPLVTQAIIPKFADRYIDGLYQMTDTMLLYVNRGLGVSELPFRLNCRPEITLYTLCRDDGTRPALRRMPAAPVLARKIHPKR